jgi:hypothetical protein
MAQAKPPANVTVTAQPGNVAAPNPARKVGYGDAAPAYSPPRPSVTTAAASSYAAPPAAATTQLDTGAGVYPQQSLFDLSKVSSDSGSSRPGNVVHPPNAYTPAGSSGGAAQSVTTDTVSDGAGVYPQQSISDVFSGK